jgi:hypothetical protein
VPLSPSDLAALIRAGALDCFGRGRQALLREVAPGRQQGQPSQGRRPAEVEPWPLAGLLDGHPLAPRWADEWEVLGLHAGPPLMALLRPTLPPALADSRSLPGLCGEGVRVAGLVAEVSEDRRSLTLVDEWGLVEVAVPPVVRETLNLAALGPVVLVEGEAQEKHGCPVLVASRVGRPLPDGASGPGVRVAVSGPTVGPPGAGSPNGVNGVRTHK